jgi:drug/metabolite transporter (DMT)-like permease
MNGNAADQKTKAMVVLVVLGALFGSAFLYMKVLVDEIAPIEIVAGRLSLGALVLFVIMAVRGKTVSFDPATFAKISLLALLDSVIPFTLIAWAETRIDSGVASVIVSTMPVFTIVIATIALPDERLAPVRLLGIPLGFLGVVTLSGGNVLDVTSGDAVGQLAVVAAAACYGAASVYAKMLLRTQDALSLTAMKLAAGAVIAAAGTGITQGVPAYADLSAEGALALLALGVFSTALAFTLYFWVVRSAGSVYASLVTYIVPVFGLLLGWAVLGEEIGVNTAFGAVLITAGVGAVMYGSVAQAWLAEWLSRVRGPALSETPLLIEREKYA